MTRVWIAIVDGLTGLLMAVKAVVFFVFIILQAVLFFLKPGGHRKWQYNLLRSDDQGLNVCLQGDPDFTISLRAALAAEDSGYYRLAAVIEKIMPGHSEESIAYQREWAKRFLEKYPEKKEREL